MNCPKCGGPLRISKKDSGFGLCDHCKKKFRLPKEPSEKSAADAAIDTVSVDAVPAQKPAKQIMDETKVMKAIQSIDGEPEKKEPKPERKPAPERKAAPEQTPNRKPAAKRRPSPSEDETGKKPGSGKKPVKKRPQQPSQSGYYTDDQYEDEPHHKKKKYANIPPSKVRSSREDEMRSSYDDLLAIENEKQGLGSKILTIVLILIILALIGCGVFYLYNRVSGGASSSAIDTSSNTKTVEAADNGDVVFEDDMIEAVI
ncbi:MAG: hypothetical protein PHQ72_12610 [Hespellia sp.]|nr:hypothetical protein [Hespellia sp.]